MLRHATEYATPPDCKRRMVAWYFPWPGSVSAWPPHGKGRGPVAVAWQEPRSTGRAVWTVRGSCAFAGVDLTRWEALRLPSLVHARRVACDGGNGRLYAGHTAIRAVRQMSPVHMLALLTRPPYVPPAPDQTDGRWIWAGSVGYWQPSYV